MKKNTGMVAAGERLSVTDFLALMTKHLEGWGWDAVLVYDRAKTNWILLQEYIERFSGSSWLPPATFDADTTPGVIERVIDYRLDKPRVSFENADLESSRLDLRMKIVGGKQLTIENPNNVKLRQVTRLKMADALNGPVLHARVSLEKVDAGVDKGRVYIDLRNGAQYYLTFADTGEEDAIGGERLRKVLEGWLDKNIFELSQVPTTEHFMKPEFITLRTQAAADSSLSGTASAGDGLVLVFVAMEGNDLNTSLPDKNFNFLIPGQVGEYSGGVYFSRSKLIEKLQAVLLKNMEREGISFKAKYEQGVITATDGGRLQPPGNTPLPNATTLVSEAIGAVYSDQRASNGHFGALTIKEVGGELQLRWSGNGTTHSSILNADHQPVDKGGFKFDFSYGCEYDFTSDAQGVISFRSKNTRYDATMVVVDWADLPRAAAALTIAEYKETLANERMPALTKGFTNFNMEIDLFILHNLLFRGAQVFQTDLVDTKDQLVILGQLSPELTTFQIDPVEPIVGAGRTHAFKITGADVPVTWSVANLPDGEGDPGEIDKITGVYTAPLRADLPDNQKRVIVTATANSGGAVSRALVGIVSRDIGLDPIVMMASAGAKGYKVRATPLDPDEKLTISMSAGALGKVIDDPDADPDVPYSKLYVPPASRAGPVSGPEPIPAHWLEYRKSPGWTVDEELAEYLHVEQVIAKGSNASTQEVEVLLLRKNITNWFEFKQSGKGIQLEHWSTNKKLGDHIVPEEMTIWIKVKGAGTLVGGLYTPDDSADETYAVIVAIEMNDDDWKWVPTILPIPFMGVETYLNMWSEDLK